MTPVAPCQLDETAFRIEAVDERLDALRNPLLTARRFERLDVLAAIDELLDRRLELMAQRRVIRL